MGSFASVDMISVDLLVIGGGINGVGIARDAAGRGLQVFLCEQGDLAQHTSSASTKLIHGGLRYLETYDFKLVRHALIEREVLLRSAPHIIWPLRFVLPYHRELRPRWLIRAGLFLYDHMGGRKILPGSKGVDLTTHVAGNALREGFTHGFEYSDCWVQDSRLVVLNAMDAEQRGATIRTRTACTGLERRSSDWLVSLEDQRTGDRIKIRAKAVVNAAGPWVEQVLNLYTGGQPGYRVRLVKGSHIVVPRLFDHHYPYLFQNSDGRVLFAIPYEEKFTLLGTTDVELDSIPTQLKISDQEVAYICEAASGYFKKAVRSEDIVWSYSGVRPLFDDAAQTASNVTRDYHLRLDQEGAPLLSVFGGKVTTYRRLAEETLDLLARPLSLREPHWTSTSHLPGGDFADGNFEGFVAECQRRFPGLPGMLLHDYCRNYGTRIYQILEGCQQTRDLGRHFGGLLYAREVAYLMEHEYAETAEDVLWRRSKKGLRLSRQEASDLAEWMAKTTPHGERNP